MNGWDGKDLGDEKNPKLQWSFAGALLYAVTVITTIGKLSTLCFSLSVRVVLTLESKLPSIKIEARLRRARRQTYKRTRLSQYSATPTGTGVI